MVIVVVVIAVDVVVVPVSSSRSLSSAEHLSPPSSRLILCRVLTLGMKSKKKTCRFKDIVPIRDPN